MGDISVDPRWDVHKDFQESLEEIFPLVYGPVNPTHFSDFSEQIDAPPNESELVRPRLWVERILFPYETHSSRGSPRFVRSHPEVEYSRLSDVSPEDVVPVETRTIDEWTHPPFSGYVDGDVLRLAIGTFI